MHVKDAIMQKNRFIGKVTPMEGFLYVDRTVQYLVSDIAELGIKTAGALILDKGLVATLEAKAPSWIGGPLYQDYAELIAEITESGDLEFPIALRNISRLRIFRDKKVYEIY